MKNGCRNEISNFSHINGDFLSFPLFVWSIYTFCVTFYLFSVTHIDHVYTAYVETSQDTIYTLLKQHKW